MELQSFLNSKCVTSKNLADKLSDYCLLYMERRSVDERLRDFVKIMGTNLSVNTIRDDDDDSWQIRYKIGPLKATVRGFDESICEQECKLKILKKLTRFSIGSDDDSCPAIQNRADVYQCDLALCAEKEKLAKIPDSTRQSETAVDSMQQTAAEELAVTVVDESTTTVVSPLLPHENGENDEDLAVRSIHDEISRENGVDYCPPNREEAPPADETAGEHATATALPFDVQPIDKNVAAVHISSDAVNKDGNDEEQIEVGQEPAGCPDESAPSVSQRTAELPEQLKITTEAAPVPNTKCDYSPTDNSSRSNDENNESDVTAGPKGQDETILAYEDRVGTSSGGGDDDDDRSPEESIVVVVQSPETLDETRTAAATEALPEETGRLVDSEMGLCEQLIESPVALLNDLSDDTLSVASKMLSTLLVAAIKTDGTYFNSLVEFIVQKAVDAFDDEIQLTVRLCAEIINNALIDERPEVRNVVPKEFLRCLLDSCALNLWDANRQPRVCDLDEHLRSLQTCKFIGQLFMLNNSHIHLFSFVSLIVNTFVGSPDANSLECVSALLTVVGPRFKKMNHSKSQFSLKKVYKILEECRTRGRTPDDVVLPLRTVSMLEHVLELRRNYWKPESAVPKDNLKTNVSAETCGTPTRSSVNITAKDVGTKP